MRKKKGGGAPSSSNGQTCQMRVNRVGFGGNWGHPPSTRAEGWRLQMKTHQVNEACFTKTRKKKRCCALTLRPLPCPAPTCDCVQHPLQLRAVGNSVRCPTSILFQRAPVHLPLLIIVVVHIIPPSIVTTSFLCLAICVVKQFIQLILLLKKIAVARPCQITLLGMRL